MQGSARWLVGQLVSSCVFRVSVLSIVFSCQQNKSEMFELAKFAVPEQPFCALPAGRDVGHQNTNYHATQREVASLSQLASLRAFRY